MHTQWKDTGFHEMLMNCKTCFLPPHHHFLFLSHHSSMCQQCKLFQKVFQSHTRMPLFVFIFMNSFLTHERVWNLEEPSDLSSSHSLSIRQRCIQKDTHSDLNWIIRVKCAPKYHRQHRAITRRAFMYVGQRVNASH